VPGANCAESFGIYSGDAPVKTYKAGAPHWISGYPTRHSAINHKIMDESLFSRFENFVPLFP
jgi:hypothetical protein